MEFNTVGYNIAGISPFHFWAIIGITVSLTVGFFLYDYVKVNISFALKSILVSSLGLMIGAILFGSVNSFIRELSLTGQVSVSSLFRGGIVFYGGLTGFILAYGIIWHRQDAYDMKDGMNVIALVVPLFHSFARIGCFEAGCCYGIVSNVLISVKYTNIIDGSVIVQNRIPTQLIESIFEMMLFIILLSLFLTKSKKNLLLIYLSTYSIYRFFIEFVRGDWDRRVYTLFSFSQLYSIIVLIVVISVSFVFQKKEGSKS